MSETITDETMTLSEIEEQFDNEWILVEDPHLNDRKQVVGGRVRCHSKNRDDVYAKAVELRLKHSAFLYTGPTPENIFLNL